MKVQNKKERISAIVVTYNRNKLLKKCLDIILRQTYPVDSIILIDNTSNDETLEFLKENSYLDSRYRSSDNIFAV